ncbi:MAG: esterase family protein [Clostridia bacterium]|nr:esterase family protein [Clostridia bacterium]
MAYLQSSIRSLALGMDTNLNIILPADRYDAQGKPTGYDKVLYMLHGLKQNADAWPRHSCIERYANHYGYAVIIPEVQRSWYCDLPGGTNYFTYITEELPELVHRMFKLPEGRENTYIGGLSMGGYGALKCALRRPDLYCGAMCYSSGFFSLENAQHLMDVYYSEGEMKSILGQDLTLRDEDSLDYLIRHFSKDAQKPRLYVSCGTEDFLIKANVRCRDLLKENGFDVTWEAWEGIHDWKFWDVAAQRSMELFAKGR